ncbi:MAG: hypothetical protein LUD68_07670 [Rikenellaceae bacterium]|nr:hypothetical protein [Rikenellaceae bacterium]
MNQYRSNAKTYTHTHTNFYLDMTLTATYHRWMLAFGLETHYDRLFGETLTVGENTHYLML